MRRRGSLLVLLGLLAACVAPPGMEEDGPEVAGDGGQRLVPYADAGPLRPTTGHLPEGNPCDPASPTAGGLAPSFGNDAAVAVQDDAGLPSESDGAASHVPAPSRFGDLVITELMADPKALSDTDGEWIELWNATQLALDLAGCVVGDAGSSHAISGPLVLEPGAYATLARKPMPGFVADVVVSLSLTNTADRVAITCGGVEIDALAYDKALGFAIVAGASLSLDPAGRDARDNDDAARWCAATTSYGTDLGTPGAPNPPCEGDAGLP